MCFKIKRTLGPLCYLHVAFISSFKMAGQAPTFQIHILTRRMVEGEGNVHYLGQKAKLLTQPKNVMQEQRKNLISLHASFQAGHPGCSSLQWSVRDTDSIHLFSSSSLVLVPTVEPRTQIYPPFSSQEGERQNIYVMLYILDLEMTHINQFNASFNGKTVTTWLHTGVIEAGECSVCLGVCFPATTLL